MPQPADELAADLALAVRLADAADAVTDTRFLAGDLQVETKPDLTPVTDADRAVETRIRALLAAERPGDTVLGEEYGEQGGAGDRAGEESAGEGSARRWIVDPIDGTKNFVRGVPVWATLIALQQDGRIVVGVASAPALGRRWWAHEGGGAWTARTGRAPRRCRVSAVRDLADASISYSSSDGWSGTGFGQLAGQVWRTRAYGDFWSHLLVAEGAVDLAPEPEVSTWDIAALQVIVTEAGGRLTDLTGADRVDGGSVLSSNGLLHDRALRVLGHG